MMPIRGKLLIAKLATALLMMLMQFSSARLALAAEPDKANVTRNGDAAGTLRWLGDYASYANAEAWSGRSRNSVEIFPDIQTSEAAPNHAPAPFIDGRTEYSITKVADGAVIVTGGMDRHKQPLASVKLWDPAVRQWRNGAPIPVARYGHRAVLLDDGRLMVTGGLDRDRNGIISVEIFDPVTNRWREAAPLLLPLRKHSAVSLCSGDVLVIGTALNEIQQLSAHAMLWRKATGQWQPAGRPVASAIDRDETQDYRLIAQQDGSALVYGYEPSRDNGTLMQWIPVQPGSVEYRPGSNRKAYASALLPDGRVLLAGGQIDNNATSLAELYDSKTNRFTLTGQMQQARFTGMPFQSSLASVVLRDGRVVVAGGWVKSPRRGSLSIANSPDLWDPVTGQWSVIKGIRFAANERVVFNTRDDGHVLFFASSEYREKLGKTKFRAWLWNPADNSVVMPRVGVPGRINAALAVLKDGRVLIIGGQTPVYFPPNLCAPQAPAEQTAAQAAEDNNEGDGDTCIDEAAYWSAERNTSAQIWDSKSGRARPMPYPQGWAATVPQTLLLRNGDVLIVNAGATSLMSSNEPEAILRWNAKTDTFAVLPPLNSFVNWPIMERRDGSLIAWAADNINPEHAMRLKPGATSWEPFPRYPLPKASVVELDSGQLLALDSRQPNVALYDEKSSRWDLQSRTYLSNDNSDTTAIVELEDGRAAFVGTLLGNRLSVQLWNPKSDSWTLAHAVLGSRGATGKAIRLRSGKVMNFTFSDVNVLLCDTWLPKEDKWVSCGSLVRTRDTNGPTEFAVGMLADGRPAMVDNEHSAMVYDEPGNRWKPMKMEMNMGPFTHPTTFLGKVGTEVPFARVFDAENDQWVDASEAGGLYYSAAYLGGTTATLPDAYSDSGLALLWDRKARDWKYIHHVKAKTAFWLPDGCVLFAKPFAIYNPASSKMQEVPAQTAGKIDDAGRMNVLSDGTVVGISSRVGSNEVGSGFFHFKASCAGLAVGQ